MFASGSGVIWKRSSHDAASAEELSVTVNAVPGTTFPLLPLFPLPLLSRLGKGNGPAVNIDGNECTTGAFCSGTAVTLPLSDVNIGADGCDDGGESNGAPKPGGADNGFSRKPGGGRIDAPAMPVLAADGDGMTVEADADGLAAGGEGANEEIGCTGRANSASSALAD